MEAGYDYTLLGGRPQRSGKYLPALFVAVLAGVLLVSGLAYYGFASDAQANPAPVSSLATEEGINASETGSAEGTGNAVKFTRHLSPASVEIIAGQELYPAGFAEAEYWANPLGYGQ